MGKVIKQKNKLKDLIYIQENKPCNRKTLENIIRAILEPVLNEPSSEGLLVHRFKDYDGVDSMMKRLEYTSIETVDFSDKSGNVKENIWENTGFIYLLTARFGACLIWDFDVEDIEDFAGYYILYNSKDLSEFYEIIKENSKIDLTKQTETYKPDRRDNVLMNESIRKLTEMLNESTQEIMISDMEKEIITEETSDKKIEFLNTKTGYISHEIRNQLSICDLYADIIKKASKENTVITAVNCIKKAVKIANNSLMDLKTLNNTELIELNVNEIIETSIDLAKVYICEKDIEIEYIKTANLKIMADENKFSSVVINLLKNAIEAIENTGKIIIETEEKAGNVFIKIENTGKKIEIKEKIFEKGFTTKNNGNGLGLYICKKTLEEQMAELKVVKSDEKSTIFEISTSII